MNKLMLTKNTDKLRASVAEHVAADSVVQGIYWDSENHKGCFIGCLAGGSDPTKNEAEYGLPKMVQCIAENIFEALPPDDARAFFAALPGAVERDGKDLSRVGWQFLAAELRELPAQPAEIQAVIDSVITGMDSLAAGQPWPTAKAAAARAWAVGAVAAASAAEAATLQGISWDFDKAVAEAATIQGIYWDSDEAADATEAVAAAGAGYAARLRQRNLLLRLIQEAT